MSSLLPGSGALRGPDGFTEVRVDDPDPALNELTGWAISRDVRLDGLKVSRPSLEDVYLELVASVDNESRPRPPADSTGP